MAKDDLIVESFFGLGAGFWMFYSGFKGLRLKRLIEEIPTSKVRSAAMGTVELAGTASPVTLLIDPLYQKPCVFYRIKVEEERGSGKRRHWVTIHTADSSNRPFWLQDETGRALILPAGADTRFKTDLCAKTGLFGSDPVATRYIASVAGSSLSSRRLSAEIIREGDPFYALGYACPMEEPMGKAESVSRRFTLPFHELARRLKADPAKMKALDKNQDGSIDAEEWEEGLRKFKQKLELEAALEKPAAEAPRPAVSGICVRQSPEGLLLLADTAERELVSSMGASAFLMIFLGPVVTVAAAAYLAWKFKLLPGSGPVTLLEAP